MNKVAIVTDSTTAIPPDVALDHNISVVPLTVNWDGKTLKDGIDITGEMFYSKLSTAVTLPTTSQPSPGDFAAVFEKLLSQGYDIFTIVLSSKISGAYDSANQALDHFPKKKILVMDSTQASMPLTIAALRTAKAALKGASLLEVENIANDICNRVKTFFVVDTLEFLHRGGRIGSAARLLGTALDLKPILTLDEGVIKPAGKVRTFKKAVERIFEMAEKDLGKAGKIDYLGVVTTCEPDVEAQLVLKAREQFLVNELYTGPISPVIGVHVGPGAVGFVYLPEK